MAELFTQTEVFVIFVKTKRCCYSKKATTYLYVQYTIVFFGDSIDDLKTVPLTEGKIKPYEDLFTPYFDYSCKNIDREVKFK